MRKVFTLLILGCLATSCQKELELEAVQGNGVSYPAGYGSCKPPTFQNDGRIVGNTTGPGANDGKIDLIPTSGKPPYQYSIDAGKTWQTGFDAGYGYSGLKPGKYFLTIKDNTGCQSLVIELEIK